MDSVKVARKVFENGDVTISINTLYDLLDGNTHSEVVKKSEIRELIEQLEEYEA